MMVVIGIYYIYLFILINKIEYRSLLSIKGSNIEFPFIDKYNILDITLVLKSLISNFNLELSGFDTKFSNIKQNVFRNFNNKTNSYNIINYLNYLFINNLNNNEYP